MKVDLVIGVVLSFFISEVTIATRLSCDDGWVRYANFCYLFGVAPVPFAEAEHYCRQRGSNLVEVYSAVENEFIKDKLRKRVLKDMCHWLGLTDVQTEGVWRYNTGSNNVANYTDWYYSQPGHDGEEDCCDFWPAVDYKWCDAPCNSGCIPICKIRGYAEKTDIVGWPYRRRMKMVQCNQCPLFDRTMSLIFTILICSTHVEPVCNPGCQNGGTCISDQTCSCPSNVHGRHCEIDVPMCKPGCENGGTCIADQTCKCQPGYLGQWCEAGSEVGAEFLPQLNTSLPLQDYQHLMSWYNVPDTSDYDRACYAKIHLQDAALDTLVTAESSYAGQMFGTYSEGPIDTHSHLNGTSRVACLQVKCPGSSLNGTEMDVNVNVTLTSTYKTCALRNHTHLPGGFSQDGSNNSFGFTLETEHNYGSTFGIYIGMGFRDKANHIARHSCLSGRRFDLTRINPALGAMVYLACS